MGKFIDRVRQTPGLAVGHLGDYCLAAEVKSNSRGTHTRTQLLALLGSLSDYAMQTAYIPHLSKTA